MTYHELGHRIDKALSEQAPGHYGAGNYSKAQIIWAMTSVMYDLAEQNCKEEDKKDG